MPNTDYILNQIIELIKVTILHKHGVELTTAQIMKIVRSQSKGVEEGMIQRKTVRIPAIGQFIITEKKEAFVEAKREARTLGLRGQARADFMEERKLAYWSEVLANKQDKTKREHGIITTTVPNIDDLFN